jgi:hypothetical protein
VTDYLLGQLLPLSDEETQVCEDLGARIVSYCDDNDMYCDAGGTDPTVQAAYFRFYDEDVVNFVEAQYNHVESGGSASDGAPDFDLEQGAAAWHEPRRGLLYAVPLAAAVAWL